MKPERPRVAGARPADGGPRQAARMSPWLPLPDGWEARSDAELGRYLVASWMAYQAEKAGIPRGRVPLDWAEALIHATASVDSDSVENAALESALRKACNGDMDAAGRMLRAYVVRGAAEMVRDEAAHVGIPVMVGRRRGGAKTAERAKKRAAPWREKCVADARALLRGGHDPRDLAGILAARFNRDISTIRKALRKAGVK